jgi:serine/threonine protein kinase/Flp pilus assembly protein TadD
MHELDIFSVALEMERPDERSDYLDRACGDNAGLRRPIEALLHAYAGVGSFMASPAGSPCATGDEVVDADAARLAEKPGLVIGPYKLLQQIGEGGMGTVFMAEQTQPVQRKVALKIIKPGMDSLQVTSRFEAERQALALMDHPNIARVLDAGTIPGVRCQDSGVRKPGAGAPFLNSDPSLLTPDTCVLTPAHGRPYFVMELVKGVPITRYCDEHHLTPRQRLELFIPVCQAVQHAHQKGIIHRDLKPSNVLVAEYDDRPVVKVIDFGVAKATGPRLTERTMFTEFGQVVGTLEYMSPEQAKLNALDVDTRSDIYALGVLLYELLTGTTPLERTRAQEAGLLESLRIIREEDTQCPSARLSTAQELPTIAANRGLEPKRLSGLVRGELDWIVMRALEKDRNRRYETANGLAMDLQRYLADEPVLACPPSRWYRLRKFARRNRPALTSAALLAAALVLTVVVLAISNATITREKEDKEQALAAAESNLLLARQAVDEMYMQVATELAGQPQMHPYQRELLRKALRFYQEFARRKSSDPLIRLETAHASLRVAAIDFMLGQRRQVEPTCRAAIAELEGLAGELGTEPRLRLVLGEAYQFLASVLADAGRRQQAEQSVRQAVALFAPLATEHPDVPDYQRRLATGYNFLGALLRHRPREAEKCHRDAIALGKKLVAGWPREGGNEEILASSYFNLGVLVAESGDPRQAEQAFRQAIELANNARGGSSRSSSLGPGAQHQLGRLLAACGQNDKAEAAYRQAVALAEPFVLLFPDVPFYRQALANYSAALARFLEDNGRPDDAAAFKHSACDQVAKLVAEFPEGIGDSAQSAMAWLTDMAWLQRELHGFAAAEHTFRKVLELAKTLASEDGAEPSARQKLAAIHSGLAVVLQRAGRLPEAADEFRKNFAIREQLAREFPGEPDYQFQRANARNYLGIALRTQPGQTEAAAQQHREAVALCDKLTADFPDQPRYQAELVRSHYALGIALEIGGRCPEAEQALLQALALVRADIDKVVATGGYARQLASIHNDLAWLRATRPDEPFRNVPAALESARQAVALDPKIGNYWNTLGVAQFRAGQCQEAVATLHKSMELRRGGDSLDWFFLAMAHERLGNHDEAANWHRRAVEWMDKHKAGDPELRRFRTEAAQLMGVPKTTK